ncbi:MAG: WYL domain-containing transcriptional regulator [Ruminococcus sp.]|nr:WYL domain-containing transcriptional regulator [Ruminococcus sp.]
MDSERILHIYKCLCRCTDEKNGVTISDIKYYLSVNANIDNVSDVTIRRDISRLRTAGYNIECRNTSHNKAYYYLVKLFSFNEMRFIVNSVSANITLSDNEKKNLIEKFKGMCSDREVTKLISETSCGRQIMEWDLVNKIDTIYDIIEEKNKINFDYGKFNIRKEMVYYHKDREIIPVKIILFSARYYLKCFDTENHTFKTYRIDRMKNIKAGEKYSNLPSLPEEKGAVLDMFQPEYFEMVRLRVKRFLMDDMIEWLGIDAGIRDDLDDKNYIIINVNVGISQGFYKWVMKYGDSMEILAPEYIRNNFISELQKVIGLYNKIS